MENEFLDLIASELEIDRSKLGADTKLDKNIDWDSMSAITVISAIDDKYNIQLDDEELIKCQTFGDIYKLISNLS